MIGYVLFGVAMIRTAMLLRWAGILVAVGAPAHLLGFGIAQLVSTAAWPDRDLGQCESRRRPRLARLSALAHTGRFGCACFRQVDTSMSTESAEQPVTKPPGTPHRVRVIIFRVVAALAGLFFVVAVVLMVPGFRGVAGRRQDFGIDDRRNSHKSRSRGRDRSP
jgi:hypothetical protein